MLIFILEFSFRVTPCFFFFFFHIYWPRKCESTFPYEIFFNFLIFKLYIIVLVLPNIKMNPPQEVSSKE